MVDKKENKEVSGFKSAFENKGPKVETKISLSLDKKWLIHKTIITDVKSVNYFKEVLK